MQKAVILDADDLDARLRAIVRELRELERDQRKWFGVDEAAEYLCLTPAAIYSMVKASKLTPHRPNGPKSKPLLFSRDQLDAWVLAGVA